jgi:mannosyltransferase
MAAVSTSVARPAAAADAGRLDRTVLAVAALTVAAAVLRFATLDVQSLWGDEAVTSLLVRRDLGDLLSTLPSSESAPPLYYLLAWAWTRVLGDGGVALRSLSALFGTLTVPVAYLAGREAGRRAGVVAAGLAATSPLAFYYAQEARAYALLILLTGLGLALWLRLVDDVAPRRLAAWAVVSALALCTHYFALFVVLPQALWLWRVHGTRAVAPALGGLALVGVALLPLALRQRADGKSSWIEDSALGPRIAQAPKQFLVGIDGPAEILTALAAGALAAVGLWLLVRRADPRARTVGLRAAAIAAAGVALPLALSVTGVIDVFNGRNVVAAWLPAVVAVAAGLGAPAARRAGVAAAVALCALSLAVVAGVLADARYQRDDWRGVADTVEGLPGRPLVATVDDGAAPLSLYLPGRAVEGRAFRARELAIVTLGERRTGRTPLPPPVPRAAPPGFRFAGSQTHGQYAVTTFVAPRSQAVTERALGRLVGPDGLDVYVPESR